MQVQIQARKISSLNSHSSWVHVGRRIAHGPSDIYSTQVTQQASVGLPFSWQSPSMRSFSFWSEYAGQRIWLAGLAGKERERKKKKPNCRRHHKPSWAGSICVCVCVFDYKSFHATVKLFKTWETMWDLLLYLIFIRPKSLQGEFPGIYASVPKKEK